VHLIFANLSECPLVSLVFSSNMCDSKSWLVFQQQHCSFIAVEQRRHFTQQLLDAGSAHTIRIHGRRWQSVLSQAFCKWKIIPTSLSTTSTETVHTSAKARLTNVAIRIRIRIQIRIRDPHRHQNLTLCSLANCQPTQKMSCKSVPKVLRKVANRQTSRQTTKKT